MAPAPPVDRTLCGTHTHRVTHTEGLWLLEEGLQKLSISFPGLADSLVGLK